MLYRTEFQTHPIQHRQYETTYTVTQSISMISLS